VDTTRVAVSNFPRHHETQTVRLMTVARDRSGDVLALASGPGYLSGWRPYMFSRLTCRSDSDRLIRSRAFGSSTVPVVSGRVSNDVRSVLGSCLSRGAVSATGCLPDGTGLNYAPVMPTATIYWGQAMPVGPAGWTEVVIQERPQALSYVITGLQAKVNASVNGVTNAAHGGDWLDRLSGGSFADSACGRCGLCDMDDSKLSCTNNNEVTR